MTEARIWWGTRAGAAQWYRSVPDRVHLFDQAGGFLGGWVAGLRAALLFMEKYGGHLVYMDGSTDRPYEVESVVVPTSRQSLSVWERLRCPAV